MPGCMWVTDFMLSVFDDVKQTDVPSVAADDRAVVVLHVGTCDSAFVSARWWLDFPLSL